MGTSKKHPRATKRGRRARVGQLSLPVGGDDSANDSSTEACQIVSVGKRRDGGTKYWCLRHRADATAKYGRRGKACRAAHIPMITEPQTLHLRLNDYPGGVALWGAVAPVYDTTERPLDRGIHVHARSEVGGKKEMDWTVRAVRLLGDGLPQDGIVVSELDAIYYMVSSIFGYETSRVECTFCGFPHLDRD